MRVGRCVGSVGWAQLARFGQVINQEGEGALCLVGVAAAGVSFGKGKAG